MNDKTKAEHENTEENRPVSDEEAGKISGGVNFSEDQFDKWSRYGTVNRSRFGPGAGE